MNITTQNTYPNMNTSYSAYYGDENGFKEATYYALGNKNRFKEGGLTMVTMLPGQMGVTKFDTMEDSFKYRDSSHVLKTNIAGMTDMFESHKIVQSEYHKLVGIWCGSVELFAEEWSLERVPFDIRDAYNDCVDSIKRSGGISTWPDSEPIQIGVDFVMAPLPVMTYTRI